MLYWHVLATKKRENALLIHEIFDYIFLGGQTYILTNFALELSLLWQEVLELSDTVDEPRSKPCP